MRTRVIVLSPSNFELSPEAQSFKAAQPAMGMVEDIYSIVKGDAKGWVVLCITPNGETKVGTKLKDAKIDWFIPIERVWKSAIVPQESKVAGIVIKRWEKTVRRPVDRPMMPGYAFARAPMRDGKVPPEAAARILATEGVQRILSSTVTGLPIPIPEAFINLLMRQHEQLGVIDRTASQNWAVKGACVRVAEGPFAGFLTTIQECLPNDVFEAALELLGKSHAVKFELAQLEQV